MKLKFIRNHVSITPFNMVELADFTVLTGVNGSGKSHLLQAIERKHVSILGMENAHIVHFNYENFKLDAESAFNAHQLTAERESAWQWHQQNIKPHAVNWKNQLGSDYAALRADCETSNRSLWGYTKDKVGTYVTNAKNLFNQPNIKNNQHAQGVYSLAKKIPFSLDEFEHDDFVRMYKPFVFKNEFLPNQLGKIFWDYYVKYRGNQVNSYENEKNGKSYEALTEEEFLAAHGEKPWELVNKVLKTFDSLSYEVTSPEGQDYFGSYQLRLQHTEKPELQIDFNGLSSGERILMALVASVYKSSSDKSFPDVLLLDEVDASLHPSMMQNMLNVIEDIFLDQAVKVILVTHSPTTIALAPENSVYVMNKSGTNRIEKRSKSDALNILTQGYATLEQGLRLFDQVSRNNITIFTEGHNSSIIRKALQIYEISDVNLVEGIEDITGKNQLRTLFDFFSRMEHTGKVIFIWDCDAKKLANGLVPSNNTYPLVIEQNNNNTFVTKGIENAFPTSVCELFQKQVTDYKGNVISRSFDDQSKKDFSKYVIENGTKEMYSHFEELLTNILQVRS